VPDDPIQRPEVNSPRDENADPPHADPPTRLLYEELDDACDKILAQIVKMIEHAEIWVIKTPNSSSRA
jgi:hypothetical protein